MDSADPETVDRALAAQGALLGRHDQDLRGIRDMLEVLSSNVADLSLRLEQGFAPQSPPPPVAGPPAPPPPPLREPHLPTPERYAGEVGACGRFLLQCALVFELQPVMYQADGAKVAYITSLLTGRAAQWALATWEGNPRLCASYKRFVAEMRGVFDHPVRGKEAGTRLLSLRQGSRSVADHAIDFSTLSTESGWDESALMGIFIHSLNDSIKDELAARDESKSLAELINLARRLDNRMRERRRQRDRSCVSPFFPPFSGSGSGQRMAFPTPEENHAPVVQAAPEPMQLGGARLTPAERQRRFQGRLCLYCGQPGHIRNNCPNLPKA